MVEERKIQSGKMGETGTGARGKWSRGKGRVPPGSLFIAAIFFFLPPSESLRQATVIPVTNNLFEYFLNSVSVFIVHSSGFKSKLLRVETNAKVMKPIGVPS